MNPLHRYMRWLHTQWPAGRVEKLPVVRQDFQTNVRGLYVVGDLTGIPLLKLSANSGALAVRNIVADAAFTGQKQSDDTLDVAIIGGGVSGYAAALEATKHGLSFQLFEATEPFSTIVNFPKAKPIYTYPTDMTPAGDLQFHEKSAVKEGLLEDLHDQTSAAGIPPIPLRVERIARSAGLFELVIPQLKDDDPNPPITKAHRVIVGIGRSGNFRKLGAPGEHLPKVYNRLHDPADFCDTRALIVGGGDSAMETAIALATCGADVTLSYRKPEFSRPKPDNIDKIQQLAADPRSDVDLAEPTSERVTTAAGDFMGRGRPHGSITLEMATTVKAIREDEVDLADADGNMETIQNDVVFSMIGREAPLDFFRRSGVTVAGDRGAKWWATLIGMLALFTFFYHWKKTGTWLPIAEAFESRNWFPHFLPAWMDNWGAIFSNPAGPIGTLRLSMGSPGFWFSLLYTALIVAFGIRRIKRRKTPYVKWQTISLMTIQVVPLFLLPYLIFPWLGHLGAFDAGAGKSFADALFPAVDYDPHGREYWRAFGLILAWPLFLWNVFSSQPLMTWLIISLVQTFVLIPVAIYFYGKGVYCGWICSCGAMAETLGDTHRHKMPHGPFWNRMNMIGQIFLAAALIILVLRIVSWNTAVDNHWADNTYTRVMATAKYGGFPAANYPWFVDLFFAGILGFGLYFHFSGRVWCRFACPLAALMHIYARFTRFRILADKKKCISCNVCTSVCHQGIDIMNFANKGVPMADPECVRCSACVQSCPTGVLTFGQINRRTGDVIKTDRLAASPVRMAEIRVAGKAV
ncbi:MAG: iron-sulfur cluster-binding protein [Planctomycetaceae bacterium]|nr:iron-sulfur cluster-binding protein [Planctomycetaceae bacterium]